MQQKALKNIFFIYVCEINSEARPLSIHDLLTCKYIKASHKNKPQTAGIFL